MEEVQSAKKKITQPRPISTFIYKENKLFSLSLKKVLAVFKGCGISIHMTANATLQSDIQEYLTVSKNYSEVCEKSESDRATAIELRDIRRDFFNQKITAAENIIMSMIGKNAPALARAGLFSFYEELAAGKHSSTILFKIADETCKSFK